MNQQFRLREENQEAERTRTGFLQSFKLRTAEKERQPVASSSSSIQGTMFQRNTEFQSNEYEGENVSSLHARLHQEADKIRKWKIQTELDLKEKDKRLIASSAQMETMKKSMLELQLDNERLSSRMQEEIDNREELIGKITSTRDMCHLLKSTTAKLEDKWLHCETEKTELKYVGREHSQHLEELSNKFEHFHISIENNQKKLISQAEKERSENIEKEKLWTSKYEEKVALIDKLECELEERNGVVTEMSAALQETTCTLEKLKEAVARMEEDNKTLKTALEAKVEDFKESSLRILTIQDEKQELEARLGKFHVDLTCLQETKEKMCLEMEASTAKHQQDMATALGNTQELQKGLQEEQQKLTSCQNELQDTLTSMEMLKSSKDLLTLEFAELELKQDLQNYETVNLKSDISDKKEEIQNLTAEMDVLTKNLEKESLCRIQLQDGEKVLQSKLSALELEKEELLQTCSDLKTSLTDKENTIQLIERRESEMTEKSQVEIRSKLEELEEERENVRKLQEISNLLQEEVSKKDTDLSSKGQSIEQLEHALKDQRSLSEGVQEELEQARASIDQLRGQCEEERSKATELDNQLKNLDVENKEHGKSYNSQQKKLAAQTKQNKEMEKELKSLKANVSSEVKKSGEKEKALKSMREEMDSLKQANQDLTKCKTDLERDMEALRQDCDKDKKTSEEAIAKALDLQEQARKEKENAKAVTECQLAEMMGTLDSYKQSSEKMFTDKEAEARHLKTRLDALEAESNSTTEKLKDDKHQLSSKVSLLLKEKEELLGQLRDTAGEIQTLKKTIQDMEKQVRYPSEDLKKSPAVDTKKNQSSHQVLPVAPVTPQKQQPVVLQTPKKTLRTPKTTKTPKTPRTPKTLQTPCQPKDIGSTNTMGMKTPQRSILRASSSVPKRRKVAFASEEDADYVPSSSDELMELEVELDTKSNQPATLCLTPSSGYRTPKLSMASADAAIRTTPLRTPILFGAFNKPLHTSTPIKKPSNIGESASTRLTSITERSKDGSKPEAPKTPKTPNVRTVATKKFFTSSPRDKATKARHKDKAKGTKGNQLWFDMDSVFGFDPED